MYFICLVVIFQIARLFSYPADAFKQKSEYQTSLFTLILIVITTSFDAIPGLISHIEQLTKPIK